MEGSCYYVEGDCTDSEKLPEILCTLKLNVRRNKMKMHKNMSCCGHIPTESRPTKHLGNPSPFSWNFNSLKYGLIIVYGLIKYIIIKVYFQPFHYHLACDLVHF